MWLLSVWCPSVSITFLHLITLLAEIQFEIKYRILIFRYIGIFAQRVDYHRGLNLFISLGRRFLIYIFFSILIRLLRNSFAYSNIKYR